MCVCCKILEHAVLQHMLEHLEQHSILTTLQHGFRTAHSCATQLVITIHDLMQYQDQGAQVDIIVLNFSKEFDTVPHDSRPWKLSHHGIKGPLLQWISSFLKRRSQRAIVNGSHSDWISVDSGVSLGTVLGPLLFLAHINDLPQVFLSQCQLFADDCLLHQPIHT